MPRNIIYLGPADSFDTGTMFDKVYQFTSPGVKALDAFDRTWQPWERGAPVAVNNPHADELMTHPWSKEHHRWAEVDQPAGGLTPPEQAVAIAAAEVVNAPNALPDVQAVLDTQAARETPPEEETPPA